MRIVIDMQGAQTASRFRGIGRYTLALAKAIIENRRGHEIILLMNELLDDSIEAVRSAFEGHLPAENMLTWTAPDPLHASDPGNLGREELAKLLRESMIASLKPDIVCITSFFEGYSDSAVSSIQQLDMHTPVCAIAYDFIPLLNPAQYLDQNPAYARYYLDKVDQLRQSSLLLAISESSRREAIDQLAMAPDKVVNIAAACDACFQPKQHDQQALHSLLRRWGVTRQFILYTGGADERKNLVRLIQAFAALPETIRQAHQLLFAGKLSTTQKNELQTQASQCGLGSDELCFTGYVSDEELIMAYSACQVFVFPSWHEGFGLPPLEAMSCGAPVIAADTSSLPEVVSWKDALFDPFDVNAITRKMSQALVDTEFRRELIAHAHRQSQKFSWKACAQTAIDAMERVCSERVQTSALTHRADYDRWLHASASAMKKHSLSSEHDLSRLAAAMARNEAEAMRYLKSVELRDPSVVMQ